MTKANILGQTFNDLTVEEDLCVRDKFGNYLWQCRCKCGNTINVSVVSLTQNNTKSCGCRKKKPKKNFIQGESGFNILYCDYKKSARQRKLTFLLSKKLFKILTSSPCHYCDSPPSNIKKPNKKASKETIVFGSYMYNGVDRKDNSLGYEEHNCVTCCQTCNYLKKSLNYDDFLSLIKKIYFKMVWVNPCCV